ncbi:translation initiation factor IF-2-like [Mustela erminea]|uniref:translation initiation factor IF-2-like n=1 Tax=Mustela erminea TaxID=36723 RepID=UPI00138726B2|nr:translation initiation factor IF-2-like [Mustela erminea]
MSKCTGPIVPTASQGIKQLDSGIETHGINATKKSEGERAGDGRTTPLSEVLYYPTHCHSSSINHSLNLPNREDLQQHFKWPELGPQPLWSAPTPPTAPVCAAAGRTPAELPAPASPALQGPATHRLEAPGCPHRPGPRPCRQEAARAGGHPNPRPRAARAHGTPASGTAAAPARPAPAPEPTPGLALGTHQLRVKVAGRRRRRSTVTRVQSRGRDGAAPRGPCRAGCGLGALGGAAAAPAAGWRLQRVGPGGATAGDRAADWPERRERNWLSQGSAERSQLLPGARICILRREGGEVTVWPLPKVWVFGVAVARALMAEKLSLSSWCSRMWSRWGPASSCFLLLRGQKDLPRRSLEPGRDKKRASKKEDDPPNFTLKWYTLDLNSILST